MAVFYRKSLQIRAKFLPSLLRGTDWCIKVHKIGQTPRASVWLIHAKPVPCTGKTQHTPDRNSCLPTLSFSTVGFWDACHSQSIATHPLYRQAKSAAVHPYHIPWSVQSISKGRHGAVSLPLVPPYLPWSALLVATDDHILHKENPSADYEVPQSI